MAINYDGVYEVRIKYTTTPTGFPLLQHTHTIDVRLDSEPTPGSTFDQIDTLNHDAAISTLDVEVDKYVNVLDDIMSSGTDIVLAELWKYPPDGQDGVLVSVYEIGVVGQVAGPATPAHQWTLTLTSLGGGIMRVQMMESALSLLTKVSYPFPSGNGNTIAGFLQTTNHPWVARDDTRPLVPRFISGTQNEKLSRKRYRPQ